MHFISYLRAFTADKPFSNPRETFLVFLFMNFWVFPGDCFDFQFYNKMVLFSEPGGNVLYINFLLCAWERFTYITRIRMPMYVDVLSEVISSFVKGVN